LVIPSTLQAQQTELLNGDRSVAQAQLGAAISHYERAATVGAPDSLVAEKLATCYLALRQLETAEAWLSRAVVWPNVPTRTLLQFLNTQLALGKYEDAERTALRYSLAASAEQRKRWSQVDAETLRKLATGKNGRCTVNPIKINSAGADLSPTLHGDRVVFASDRGGGRAGTWNGAPYLDLYEADVLNDGQLGEPRNMNALNTRYHESNATFSPQGDTVWFDRNAFHDGKKDRNANGVMALRIYQRSRKDGTWTAETPFLFNGEIGSTCHPNLSPKGDILFFASDRPGGYGGSDIWYSVRDKKGNWKPPVCLGPEVNTEGNERFPFLSAQGDLYFASDGHPGLGGLDILRCPFDGRKVTGTAMNPGAPLNSNADDFGISLSREGTYGYFTSDRSGGPGGDDLYHVSFPEPIVGAMGVVRDRISAVLLPGTRVLITNSSGQPMDSTVVDSAGAYRIALQRGREQNIVFSLPGYRTLSYPVTTSNEDTVFRIDPPMAFLRSVVMWMHVTNSQTGEGVDSVAVIVLDAANDGRVVIQDTTDEHGDHRSLIDGLSLRDSLTYRVKLNRAGYYPKKGLFLYVIPDVGEIAMHHEMDISMDPIVVGKDAGKALELRPILFATGKWDILPEAAMELDKVIELMQQNPTMTIELCGHTDSRGSSTSNRTLSAERSKSAANYITGGGIYADRIRWRGLGESALLNRCTDGVTCSEEEHAINRRTEFIVKAK